MKKYESIKIKSSFKLTQEKKEIWRKVLLGVKGMRENILGHRIRKVIHPLLMKVMKKMRNYELIPIGDTEKNLKKLEEILKIGPVIFAINHSNVHDVPTASEIIKKHSYLLASDEVRGKFNGFLFELMGVAWVQREKNKKPKIELPPKEHMLKLLAENQSVKTFPERTWNVTDNEIILPFKWGDVLVSQKSQKPIVPIVMEYNYTDKVCYYNIGTPMSVSKDVVLIEANNKLRDEMATLRYEIWEDIDKRRKQKPGFLTGKEYTEFAREEFYSYKQKLKEEYPLFEEQEEAKYIYRPYTTHKVVFQHLNELILNENNAFLFNKRIK